MNILTSLFGRLKRTQHDRDVIRERTVALALITTLEMQHLEAREAVRYSAQASAIGYQFELARQRLSPQEQEPFPSTRTLDHLAEEAASHFLQRSAPLIERLLSHKEVLMIFQQVFREELGQEYEQ